MKYHYVYRQKPILNLLLFFMDLGGLWLRFGSHFPFDVRMLRRFVKTIEIEDSVMLLLDFPRSGASDFDDVYIMVAYLFLLFLQCMYIGCLMDFGIHFAFKVDNFAFVC